MEPGLTAVTSLGAEFTTVSCRRWRIPDDIPLRDDLLQKKNMASEETKKKHMHCSRLVRSR